MSLMESYYIAIISNVNSKDSVDTIMEDLDISILYTESIDANTIDDIIEQDLYGDFIITASYENNLVMLDRAGRYMMYNRIENLTEKTKNNDKPILLALIGGYAGAFCYILNNGKLEREINVDENNTYIVNGKETIYEKTGQHPLRVLHSFGFHFNKLSNVHMHKI